MTDPLHYLSVDNAVTAVAFGRFADAMSLLAVGESFGTLSVWDTRSWRCVRKIAGTPGGILWLHFTNDGKLIAQVRVSTVQVVPSGRRLGLVDLEFDCSTVCPTLPGLVGIGQYCQ